MCTMWYFGGGWVGGWVGGWDGAGSLYAPAEPATVAGAIRRRTDAKRRMVCLGLVSELRVRAWVDGWVDERGGGACVA